jgi:NTP pyrophosphatase (non-canonical NTP hydrolase)
MQGRALDRGALAKELGDALWCLAIAARCIEMPLSEVAARNLEKLRERHPEGFEAR